MLDNVAVLVAAGFRAALVQHGDAAEQVGTVLGRERGVVGENAIEHLAPRLVGPLGAVDDRATLDGDTAPVGLDLVVGEDAPDRHVEPDVDHVTRLPLARSRTA